MSAEAKNLNNAHAIAQEVYHLAKARAYHLPPGSDRDETRQLAGYARKAFKEIDEALGTSSRLVKPAVHFGIASPYAMMIAFGQGHGVPNLLRQDWRQDLPSDQRTELENAFRNRDWAWSISSNPSLVRERLSDDNDCGYRTTDRMSQVNQIQISERRAAAPKPVIHARASPGADRIMRDNQPSVDELKEIQRTFGSLVLGVSKTPWGQVNPAYHLIKGAETGLRYAVETGHIHDPLERQAPFQSAKDLHKLLKMRELTDLLAAEIPGLDAAQCRSWAYGRRSHTETRPGSSLWCMRYIMQCLHNGEHPYQKRKRSPADDGNDAMSTQERREFHSSTSAPMEPSSFPSISSTGSSTRMTQPHHETSQRTVLGTSRRSPTSETQLSLGHKRQIELTALQQRVYGMRYTSS